MKISQLMRCCVISIIVLFSFSCVKTIPPLRKNGNDTTVITKNKKCDPLHSCPVGYFCDSGYCKKIGGCNCLVRPIPPGCVPECGP
jgi:hypothetical protein